MVKIIFKWNVMYNETCEIKTLFLFQFVKSVEQNTNYFTLRIHTKMNFDKIK